MLKSSSNLHWKYSVAMGTLRTYSLIYQYHKITGQSKNPEDKQYLKKENIIMMYKRRAIGIKI